MIEQLTAKLHDLEIKEYKVTNAHGMEIILSSFGASLHRLYALSKEGAKVNVVLGYDTLEEYETSTKHFGATIGRVGNRIADASFTLNGVEYPLTANNGTNCLHGGRDFYEHRVWESEIVGENSVKFSIFSPDGDQGFPGGLEMAVTYTLTEDDELQLLYEASADADTIFNPTNHSYFNLGGDGSGLILDDEVRLFIDGFTDINEKLIPTGEVIPAEGTPFDFSDWKVIGKEIDAEYGPLVLAGGYDHNLAISGSGYREAGAMRSAKTGIVMEVSTDLPGMQFYTSNFIVDEKGIDGARYLKRSAACFETQYFPDAIHHENFEGPVLKAGEKFVSKTAYAFSVME